MSRLSRTVFITLAALMAAATGSTALMAQTKPKITTLGPDFPKTEIFIGNSFFYYNNSMHSHVLGLERAADPAHKQDYRATSVTTAAPVSTGTTSRAISAPTRSATTRSTSRTMSSSTSSTDCSTRRS